MNIKNPTIGEIADAFSIIAAAAEQMSPSRLSALMVDELYGCQSKSYLRALEFAGDRAQTLSRELWLAENAHLIVDTRERVK